MNNKPKMREETPVKPGFIAELEAAMKKAAVDEFLRTLAASSGYVTGATYTVAVPGVVREIALTINVAPEPSRDQPVRSCPEPRSSTE